MDYGFSADRVGKMMLSYTQEKLILFYFSHFLILSLMQWKPYESESRGT